MLLRALLVLTCTFALFGCASRSSALKSPASAAESQARLPARLRRLSNFEYERTVSELLGAPVKVASRLPPDVRVDGYTNNAEQSLPAALATRLSALSRELAHEAVESRLDALLDCRQRDSRCRDRFIERYATRAFRRHLGPEELRRLTALFEAAAGQGKARDFAAGVELVLVALLQSPSLLYIDELGPEPRQPGEVFRLGPYETASALSYMIRGGPPDAALLKAAGEGKLEDPEGREQQARRLLGQSDTRHQFRRFVLEWLEVDELEHTAKSLELYPEYESLKSPMLAETSAFVDEVMVHRGGSLKALLTAGFSSVTPKMARFYGLSAYGPRVRLLGTGRVGVLQQASFLSAHAHPDSTSPVKRGDFVLRKLLCHRVPRPGEVDIEVVMPPLDPKQTTRQRFSAHAKNPGCAGCHEPIDALGFTFESFDAVGQAQTRDHGQPVDSSTHFRLRDSEQSFKNSLELSEWLASSERARECFASQAFRFFTAQADPAIQNEFLRLWRELPEQKRGSVLDTAVAFVKSDLFVERRMPESTEERAP